MSFLILYSKIQYKRRTSNSSYATIPKYFYVNAIRTLMAAHVISSCRPRSSSSKSSGRIWFARFLDPSTSLCVEPASARSSLSGLSNVFNLVHYNITLVQLYIMKLLKTKKIKINPFIFTIGLLVLSIMFLYDKSLYSHHSFCVIHSFYITIM